MDAWGTGQIPAVLQDFMQWKTTQPWLEKVWQFRYHQFLIRFHQRVTEMTEEKVWELLAELVASQKKTDEQLAKTDAQLAKTWD